MADPFYDPEIDGIFEELAEFTGAAAFSLPPLMNPAASFGRPTLTPLGAFPPLLPHLLPRPLASPSPFFGAPIASLGQSSAISPTFNLAPFHADTFPRCPAHPANRPFQAPRPGAGAPNPGSTTATAHPLASAPATLRSNSISANFNHTGQSSSSILPPPPRVAGQLPGFPTTPTSWRNPTVRFSTASSFTSRDPNDDLYFLNELVSRDFSSPSIFSHSPQDTTRATNTANATDFATNPLRGAGLPSATASSNLVEGQPQAQATPTCDSFEGQDHQHPRSSPTPASEMSARQRATRRNARLEEAIVETAGLSFPSTSRSRVGQPSKQEPSSATGKRKRDGAEPFKSDDNLFGDDELEIVDLADTEEVPAALLPQPKPKNEIRLGSFQCVICMDDVTDLTVTHCGHLFCSGCLHSSLHIDATRKICPICRQKIEARPGNGKFTQKAKGFYPLELKLMTKKSLGKRAA